MTNQDMLNHVDDLRERADLTYEEAIELLERNDNDVMRALVELEQQGRLHGKQAEETRERAGQQCRREVNDAKEKATSFFKKACQTRVVVERKGEDGEKETIANLSAPFALGVTIVAPYVTLASAVLGAVSGYQMRIRKEEKGTVL